MDLAITQRPCIVLRKGSRVITIPSNSNQIGIASGTLRLKRSIVDTDIEFGVPIASEFSVELFNIEEDLRGWEIEVSLKDTTQPVPIYTALFTGVIDSSKTDNIGHTRQIVAYDWIYYHRDDNVASWWNNYWQPATGYSIKTVRNAFLQYLGFTTPTKSYVNDTDSIISWSSDDLPIMSTITVGQVLKMLCEMQGTFPFIDPFGNLDFATLDDTYTVDITGQYETGNSTWEDFTTDTITGVSLYSSSEDLLTSVGTVDNVYNIAGNIWLMHLEDYYHDNVITVLTNLLNFIDDIQYKPCNIKMIKSNINLYLGQRVLTDRGYTYVMSNELSGVCFVEQTIQGISSASKLPKEVSDANDTMVQENKLSKTYSEINQLKDRIVLKVDASGKIVQAELSADPSTGSEFKVSADNIDFIANGVMNLTANNLGISSTNFSINPTTGAVTVNGSITCNDGKISLYNSDYDYTAEIVTDLEEFVTNGYDYNVNTGLIEETSGGAVAYPVIKFNQANPLVINNGVDIVGDLTVTNGDISAFRHNVTAKKAVIQDSVMTTELFATTDVKSNLYKLYTRYNNTDYEKDFIQGERNQNYIGWTMYGFKDTTYFQSKYGLPADFMLTGSLWMTSYLTLNNQTANTVAIFDSSKRVVSSAVTPTELGYLSGATGNIQGQIDNATTITTKEDNEPYLKRSGVAIGDREYLDKLIGGTIAWNQYVQNGNFVDTSGWSSNSASLSASNNVLSCTLSGGAWNQDVKTSGWSIAFKVNHKYLITFGLQCTSGIDGQALAIYIGGSWAFQWGMSTTRTVIRWLYTPSSDKSFSRFLFAGSASGFGGEKYMIDNFMVFDLTQMFGSTIADYIYSLGDNGSVEYLQSYGFLTKEYYPYTTGELVSTKPSAHITSGENVWDGTYKVGHRYNGTYNSNSNYWTCNDYIPVLPNTKYYCFSEITVSDGQIQFYNSNKSYISAGQFSTSSTNIEDNHIYFITPSNCAYMTFYVAKEQSKDVFISTENKYSLANIDLRGKISLQTNKLAFSGDEYISDGIVARYYAIIELDGSSDESWSKSGSASNGYYIRCDSLSPKLMPYNTVLCNSRFVYTSNVNDYFQKYGFVYVDNSLCFSIDPSTGVTDVTTLKQYLANNPIYVLGPVMTPTTELTIPYTNPQICGEDCIEEFIDTRDVPMPVGQNTEYIDIPEWMDNRYFDDLREIPYEITSSQLYTTSERRVGIWIDGKPLYQKTILVQSTGGTNIETDVSDLNADYLAFLRTDATNATYSCSTFAYGTSDYYYPYYNKGTKKLYISVNGTFKPVGATFYVTVVYTKQT